MILSINGVEAEVKNQKVIRADNPRVRDILSLALKNATNRQGSQIGPADGDPDLAFFHYLRRNNWKVRIVSYDPPEYVEGRVY